MLRTGAFLLCGLMLLSAPPVQADESAAAACELASEIVERRLADAVRPMVVSASDSWRVPQTVDEFRRGWENATPSDSVLQAYLSRTTQSPLEACPALVRYLDQQAIPHGPEAEAKRQSKLGVRGDGADALMVSLPAVSQDGREAIVDIGVTCPGLCGHGMFVYFRKDEEGLWKRVGYSRMWFS